MFNIPSIEDYTVDSLFSVGYHIFGISWVQVNHKIKCSTNGKFSKRLYADFHKATTINIHEHVSFCYYMKIGTHGNK